MRKIQFSLTHRVAIAFLAILLPLFIVFYLNYRSQKEQIETLVLDALETLADERQKNLLFFLELNRAHIRDLSNDIFIRRTMESAASKSSALGEYIIGNNQFFRHEVKAIALFSPEGKLVSSTGEGPEFADASAEEFFKKGLGTNHITENAQAFGGPGLVFSSPVLSMDRVRVIGVAAGFLPAALLNDVMKGAHVAAPGNVSWVNRWETIETYLVNRDGGMITESRFMKDSNFTARVRTSPVKACVEEAKETKGFYEDYRGVKVAGASTCLPGYGWTLIAEIDEDEALRDLKDTRFYALIAFLAVSGFVLFLVIYFIRSVVKPIEGFSVTAARLAGGDYDVTVPVVSKDEIGVLSETFNVMAARIKERSEALALSRERLSNAQRIAHIGNWDLDIARNELHCSDEVYRIFGITGTGQSIKYDMFLSAVHPDDRAVINAAFNDSARKGVGFSIDHRINLPTGETRIVHEETEVMHDQAGNLRMISGTVQDITERKKTEEEVRKLNAELEDKVRERTFALETAVKGLESFSYSVAHDLRAPLRTIDGFSQAFVEDYGELINNEGRDYLRRIRDGSQRMGHLIDDLLTLSHVTRTEMKREEVDLSLLAESVSVEHQRASAGREVALSVAPGLKSTGDPGLLRVVLDNLIGNAFKFTGKKPSASIRFHSPGKDGLRTIYSVSDNGIGFDMRYSDKLFTPFQRLHSSVDFQGTGIGLATVERIIWRHGGRVWAEGEPGKGASFYFTL